MANLLTLDGVEQYYGESHTLWDLKLAIKEGSITCLMGRNGVGINLTKKYYGFRED